MVNLDMRNMQDHYPRRGDQIEAWIKDRRDEANRGDFGAGVYDSNGAYYTLDELLDEYRLAADTGQSLENIVNAEYVLENPEPVIERPRKKKNR